jgi:hypothetical protein
MSLTAPKVSPFGEEFGYVEHLFRIESGLPTVSIEELYDVSLKPINTQFDNYLKSHLPNDVANIFVPMSEIKQSKNDIIAHGIKVHPKDGFTFTTGSVKLVDGPNELLHIKVAMSSVLNYIDTKEAIGEVVYLKTPPTVTNLQEGFSTLRIGDNKFVVFAQQQVKACHIIKVNVNKAEAAKPPTSNVCDNCGKVADVYCYNCGKKFCKKCEAEAHNNKYMKDHKREDLKAAIMQIQKCPEHPDQMVQYYCSKCHKAVCMQCKVKGNHAHGEFAKHKLTAIDQAYNDTLTQLKKNHPFFDQRAREIEKGIKDSENRINEIMNNQKQIEEEIMRIAMKAIEEARVKSTLVANEVKSTQLELKRKQEELQKQKDLLELYRQNGEPLPLLNAAYRNQCIEAELADNSDLPKPLTQKGNLVVYGRLDIAPPKQQQKTEIKERGIPQSGEYSYDNGTYETTLEERDPHYTRLEKMAARKQAKYDSHNITINFRPFEESTIILDPATREKLYLSLPFRGVPEPHILYSSAKNGLNIHTMHKMIDGMGITCIIIKSGDQVFGGFAASKWDSKGIPKKDKSSTFLFQINKDAFIPYGGQSEDPCYMVATESTLSFGGLDLKLAGKSFEDCSSELENSFGIGFTYGSKKAKEFLAGKHKFAVDSIEVWGFFSAE